MNQYIEILKNANKPLILAVGGGNDSVSTLLLQKQLEKDFGYVPKNISIVAVLPDCLDYQNLEESHYNNSLISIINTNTTRSVQGKVMKAFPEPILSQYKNKILPVRNVYGISMAKGSIGVANALIDMIKSQEYDLVLAIDVGGDFIAVPENVEVLSPMMDGYMLYSLKELNRYISTLKIEEQIPVLYSIFGLGTDGESSPKMLAAALNKLPDYYEGSFDKNYISSVIDFYRSTVEPNRYSRTADFTIREIEGIGHDNPAIFRGRFHVKTNEGSNVHYGIFNHTQDTKYFGKYYLFDDIENVNNPFAVSCSNGIEWFISVQNQNDKVNHELNGQAYMNLDQILNVEELNNKSLLFGTPSRKFNQEQQATIAKEIIVAIENEIYDFAMIYRQQQQHLENDRLYSIELNDNLTLIGKNKVQLEFLSSILK